MAFVPVPFTVRTVVKMTYTGVPVACTMDIGDDEHDTFGSGDYFDGIAEDIWNNWRDHIMPLLAAAIHLESVETQDQSEEDGEQGQFTAAAVVGGQAAQCLPANCCYVVKKRTARAGRNFAGRWFVPGITEDVWQGTGQGAFPGATIAAWNTALALFLDGTEDGSRPPGSDQRRLVVASRFDGTDGTGKPIPRATGLTADVTSLTLTPLLGTMRRRVKR